MIPKQAYHAFLVTPENYSVENQRKLIDELCNYDRKSDGTRIKHSFTGDDRMELHQNLGGNVTRRLHPDSLKDGGEANDIESTRLLIRGIEQ